MLDVVVVGAGAAGIGVSTILADLGVEDMLILEREKVGTSFKKWPKEMQLITPSFTTNFYGQADLNSIMARSSPAYFLRKEHPTGREYAQYLESLADFCDLPVIEHTNKPLVVCGKIDSLQKANELLQVNNIELIAFDRILLSNKFLLKKLVNTEVINPFNYTDHFSVL